MNFSLPPRRRRDPSVLPTLTHVQSTAVEALNGKLSCVSRGYYEDPFIGLLRPPTASSPPVMSPLINRGEAGERSIFIRLLRIFVPP